MIAYINQLVAESSAGSRSIIVGGRALDGLAQIRGVILVGSSCAGKTTLVNQLRRDARLVSQRVVFPRRLITRPRRSADDDHENQFINPAELSVMEAGSQISLCWSRNMGDQRQEHYAFVRHHAEEFPVFSANNAILMGSGAIEQKKLRHYLVCGIYAPDELRRARFCIRSPDLLAQRTGESAMRLADSSEHTFDRVHVLARNYGRYESLVVECLGALIAELAYARNEVLEAA